VFTVLFGVYLHARGQDSDLFATSHDTLNRNFGAVNTLVLLVSSLFVVLAWHALRDGTYRRFAPPLLIGALICGLCFVGMKVAEYHEKIEAGLTPATNDFYMYYFVLTGLHLFHLVIGLVMLLVLLNLSRKPNISPRQLNYFEGGACFWHMVDLLWIVIFPLTFLMRA
jgi:nitric oxide reductase NorE protein